MGTGYTRNDTSNNIADGKIIDAADLDGEFDAIESAFNNSTGHTHDGTASEGAPIEKTGPAQEYLFDATAIYPKADNTYDLGKSSAEFKDLYLDGVANIDTLTADAGTVGGESIVTASTTDTLTNKSIDSATNTLTIDFGEATVTTTLAQLNSSVSDATLVSTSGTETLTNKTLAVPTINLADINGGTIDNAVIGGSTAVAITGTTITANTGFTGDLTGDVTGNVTGDVTGNVTGNITSTGTSTFSNIDINGGTISGITDLAIADGGTGASTASAARSNLGLTIGTNVQAYDAGLASIASLSPGVDRFLYTTGADTWASAPFTSFARSLVTDSSASEMRSTLGLGGLATLNILDEDTFSSNSATRPPSQQSTKVYVDGQDIGIDQEWTDTIGSRSVGTSYQNTTGKPIQVVFNGTAEVSTDNTTWVQVSNSAANCSFIVPPSHYYKNSAGTVTYWKELR